jgi:hypothetical protein
MRGLRQVTRYQRPYTMKNTPYYETRKDALVLLGIARGRMADDGALGSGLGLPGANAFICTALRVSQAGAKHSFHFTYSAAVIAQATVPFDWSGRIRSAQEVACTARPNQLAIANFCPSTCHRVHRINLIP